MTSDLDSKDVRSDERAAEWVPWPAETAAAYRDSGYWLGEPLYRVIAAGDPAAVAVVDPQRRITYGELASRTERLAAGLLRTGLRPGDNVVVQLPNRSELVVLMLALFRIGVRPVFAMASHRQAEITYFARHTEARAYFIVDRHQGFDYRPLARQVGVEVPSLRTVIVVGDPAEFHSFDAVDAEPADLPVVDPGTIALFLLSGGTTGVPKLIPRTHDDYSCTFRGSAQVCEFDSGSVYLAALPMVHNFPLASPGVLGALSTGGTVVLAPDPSPATVFALIEREGVTVTSAVPAVAELWAAHATTTSADLSSLAMLQIGGARLDPEAALRISRRLRCPIQQVFGMAEGLICYTRSSDTEEVRHTTQGRPMSPADEIRVLDADGVPVPAGSVGELHVRGPYTIRGYYRAPEHNRSAFTTDGFYRTGDLVRVTDSGHLVVMGRIKDQINRGGEKISAPELERHLLSHGLIRDVAVVPIADDRLGERICAVVVADGAAPSLRDVLSHLRTSGVAAYKHPDILLVADRLPRTPVGKVDKRALADQAARELRTGGL
ncbi:AMP-binding protein [Nocardia huaxiensis]|uniref:AMP-binding protein n=1 Tax=Nocardia huaxiensis TaxID=2755382 RepID=A0A7D6VNC2_9NOCA|nr:AMP-binding protein [Nocardia huaxiensis]QLY33570.1 AMP-binding protein [Nocardia huaxiensis]